MYDDCMDTNSTPPNEVQTPQPPARDASAEDILNSVVFEIDTTQKPSADIGIQKLRDAAALSSDVIISIMLYDEDSRVRLKAAEIVQNRVYGTGSQAKPLHDPGKSLYDHVFESIVEANNQTADAATNGTEAE